MAVTQEQVQQAYDRRSAAESALTAAQQQLANTPVEKFQERESLNAQIKMHEGEYDRANRDYERISADYNKENPTKTPPAQTPGQAARDQGAVKDEAEKDQNEAETGRRETNAARATREQREGPKPMTPAQQAAANTAQARLRETQRANAAREQQTGVKTQIDAMTSAANTTTTARGQVAAEANQRNAADRDIMDASRGAATTLTTTATARRQQQIDISKARADMGQSVLTAALPKVLELMMNTPKGSPIARNFLIAMLAVSDRLVKEAGLKDIPELDENSPEQRRLREITGYGAGRPAPSFPTSSEISWDSAKQLAFMGMPPPGWNGPMGPAALDLPDKPKGTMGDGTNPIASAQQSEEGRAIATKYQTPEIQAAEQRIAAGTATPEDRAAIVAAREAYNGEIKALANKNKTNAATMTPGMSQMDETKRLVRQGIMTGTPDQQLKVMALASTAAANRDAGKQLSPEEISVLSNIDPEDLAIIRRTYTPQIQSIIQKQQQGLPLSEQEYALVKSGVGAMSTEMKNRVPNIPAPVSTTTVPTPSTPPPAAAPAQPLAGPQPTTDEAEAESIRNQILTEIQQASARGVSSEEWTPQKVDEEVQRRLAVKKAGRVPAAPAVDEEMPKLIDPQAFKLPETTAVPEPEDTMPKLIAPPETPGSKYEQFQQNANQKPLDLSATFNIGSIEYPSSTPKNPWDKEEEDDPLKPKPIPLFSSMSWMK